MGAACSLYLLSPKETTVAKDVRFAVRTAAKEVQDHDGVCALADGLKMGLAHQLRLVAMAVGLSRTLTLVAVRALLRARLRRFPARGSRRAWRSADTPGNDEPASVANPNARVTVRVGSDAIANGQPRDAANARCTSGGSGVSSATADRRARCGSRPTKPSAHSVQYAQERPML